MRVSLYAAAIALVPLVVASAKPSGSSRFTASKNAIVERCAHSENPVVASCEQGQKQPKPAEAKTRCAPESADHPSQSRADSQRGTLTGIDGICVFGGKRKHALALRIILKRFKSESDMVESSLMQCADVLMRVAEGDGRIGVLTALRARVPHPHRARHRSTGT